MIVGMGAVATTLVAGIEAVRKGLAKPIGSLTQMGTIRLGKRTEGNSPLIRDFVPLANLDDLVFTGWDIFPDNMFQAASTAGVLDRDQLASIKPFLEGIRPLCSVFDQHYVKRLSGENVKKGKNKRDLAEQIRADIRAFKKENRSPGDDLVWFRPRSSSRRPRCTPPSRPSRRACWRTTSTSRRRCSMPTPR